MTLIDDSGLESSCQATCRLPDGSIDQHALDITGESRSWRKRGRELDVIDDGAQLWRRRVHRHETDSKSGLTEAAKNSADVSDGAAHCAARIPDPDREDCPPHSRRPIRGTAVSVGGDEESNRLQAGCCQPACHRAGDPGHACGHGRRAQFPQSARRVVCKKSILRRREREEKLIELGIELTPPVRGVESQLLGSAASERTAKAAGREPELAA